jgi:hypothetical protein
MGCDVICIGYAACCRLWLVQGQLEHGGHYTGRQLGWTISGDAGLVATRLAAHGRSVWGVFNYVEDRANGSVLDRFFRRQFCDVTYVGSTPPSDSLLLIDSEGVTFWLSDVGPALTCFKVRSRPLDLPATKIVYLDAYEWLAGATLPLVDSLVKGNFSAHFLINAGATSPGGVESLLANVERYSQSHSVILQLSLAQIPEAARENLKARVLAATRRVLLTDGSRGLALLWEGEEHQVAAKVVEGFCDPSGAGAAISVALCELLLTETMPVSEWADHLNDVGREQCTVHGSLDRRSWTALNSEFDQ